MNNHVMIQAHRGASAYAPENTLPSFQLAVDMGADGIECDIHLSKDGRFIVCHDDKVDRTSNGTGSISDLTLAEIKALDFGAKFDAKFAGTSAPTLEEMLDNDFTLYSFMPRFYSFVTSIRADYLIASHYKNTSYVFMIREGERSVISDCVCCSAFVKDSRDYEQNQRSFALLHKSKTNLSSDTTSVLYVKEGFVLPSLRDEQ